MSTLFSFVSPLKGVAQQFVDLRRLRGDSQAWRKALKETFPLMRAGLSATKLEGPETDIFRKGVKSVTVDAPVQKNVHGQPIVVVDAKDPGTGSTEAVRMSFGQADTEGLTCNASRHRGPLIQSFMPRTNGNRPAFRLPTDSIEMISNPDGVLRIESNLHTARPGTSRGVDSRYREVVASPLEFEPLITVIRDTYSPADRAAPIQEAYIQIGDERVQAVPPEVCKLVSLQDYVRFLMDIHKRPS